MRPTLALAAAVAGLAALPFPGAGAGAGSAPAANGPYQAALFRWRAADAGFASWETAGAVRTAGGRITLDPPSAQPGSDAAGAYQGRNFYNGGAYTVGEATGPLIPAGFGFSRAVASWDADTPPGTWIEVLARAQRGGRLTRYYNLGVWAADGSTVGRHSVEDQRDGDGTVNVDTLVLSDSQPADAIQLKVRLFSARPDAVPSLRLAAVAVSTEARRPAQISAGDPRQWNKVLDVPACSQQAYPDGGERWCSPTSTAMVVGFWTHDRGPCEPRVRAAVDGVYDWVFDGYGNWPFNAAYAATAGELDGYVVRFTGLAQAEPWIAAGVPVVMSYAWTKGALTGAPVSSSKGHLGVLVGFDAQGNPVMNDPAAGDGAVRRTYPRGELEALWLEHSGGTAYLIYPSNLAVPGWPGATSG
jgi:Peptidase_C39 like family